ncbi:MAG: hypothetical protein E6J87_13020 [Deltaproteobacteria bacterium]|nr:MAG: hypothetical protein E6J87_13020 [Deltaproteobacteria bacterium]
MRISTGKVVSGKVELEGDPLPEGSVVTVLAPDGEEFFDLTEEEENLLLTSIRQAEAGQVRSASDVLAELPEA